MSIQEQNKQRVVTFQNRVFNDKDLSAALEYVREDYIQHNPEVPNGRAAFMAHFGEFVKTHPDLRWDIKRVFAEGDYVIVHGHWVERPGERGDAVVDILRMQDGLIAEHWDVIQPIPETTTSGNSML
jgi:predicted SnoaL-like aldol condensation-catalyzing enzyme